MEVTSYCFIVNPVAGKNKAEKLIPLISKTMLEKKLDFNIMLTRAKGDGKVLAEKAVKEGFKVIVAVGGDGTINEVVNGLYDKNCVLGIIPAGTGNDFAKSLNITTDFVEALDSIVKGSIKEIDTGLINNNLFINVASIGLDAHIAAEANKIKKYFSGKNAYIIALLKGIVTYKCIDVRIVIEDKVLDRSIMLAAFCNGAYYGGGMNIAPNADPTDGYLDICIVEKMSKLKLLRLFPTIFKGNHIAFKEVRIYRAKDVKVYLQKDIVINTDGEIIRSSIDGETQEIQTKIVAKKLKIMK